MHNQFTEKIMSEFSNNENNHLTTAQTQANDRLNHRHGNDVRRRARPYGKETDVQSDKVVE